MFKKKIINNLNQKGGVEIQCAFEFDKRDGAETNFVKFFKYYTKYINHINLENLFNTDTINKELKLNHDFFNKETIYVILGQSVKKMQSLAMKFNNNVETANNNIYYFLLYFKNCNNHNRSMFKKTDNVQDTYHDKFYIKFNGNDIFNLCQDLCEYGNILHAVIYKTSPSKERTIKNWEQMTHGLTKSLNKRKQHEVDDDMKLQNIELTSKPNTISMSAPPTQEVITEVIADIPNTTRYHNGVTPGTPSSNTSTFFI